MASLWPVLASGELERRSGAPLSVTAAGMLSRGGYDLAMDTSLTSVMLAPLALAGLIALFVRRKFRLGAGALLLFALPMIPALAVIACRTDLIRYQAVAHFGLILLACAVATAVPGKWARWAPAVIGVAIVAPVLPHLKELRTPSLDASAFLLAQHAVAKLPDGAVVRIAPRRDGPVLTDFPEFLAQGRSVSVEDDPSVKGKCHIWIGPSCYSFTADEVANGIPQKATKLGEAPLRKECYQPVQQIDAAAPPIEAAVVPVPWAEREFFSIPAHEVLIGLFPCSTVKATGALASP